MSRYQEDVERWGRWFGPGFHVVPEVDITADSVNRAVAARRWVGYARSYRGRTYFYIEEGGVDGGRMEEIDKTIELMKEARRRRGSEARLAALTSGPEPPPPPTLL